MGILKGLIFAVGLTLIALVHKLSSPKDSVLGRLPGTENFVDIERHPEAEQIPGLLIFRPNGILFFANANRIHHRLQILVKQAATLPRGVLVNLEACPEMDVTSLEMLEKLRRELHESGIALYFARVPDPVRDLLLRSGFLEDLGETQLFRGVDAGVAAFLERPQSQARARSA